MPPGIGYSGAMSGSGPGGQMTEEERLYWLEHMPAITQQESEIAQAQALSDQLRLGMNPQARKRMDWASQGARAIEGLGSGLQDRRVAEGTRKLDADRKTFGLGLANMMRQRQQPQLPQPIRAGQYDLLEEDEEGFRRNAQYG